MGCWSIWDLSNVARALQYANVSNSLHTPFNQMLAVQSLHSNVRDTISEIQSLNILLLENYNWLFQKLKVSSYMTIISVKLTSVEKSTSQIAKLCCVTYVKHRNFSSFLTFICLIHSFWFWIVILKIQSIMLQVITLKLVRHQLHTALAMALSLMRLPTRMQEQGIYRDEWDTKGPQKPERWLDSY